MLASSNQSADVKANVVLSLEVRHGEELVRLVKLLRVRTTIGRRPYNDLELAHPTVSGEHAVFHLQRGELNVHDLNSRNGTLVNGVPMTQKVVKAGDKVQVGVFMISVVAEQASAEEIPEAIRDAYLLPMTGSAGHEVIDLKRPINSVGRKGKSVAVIARRRSGYFVTHLEGDNYPLVNGESIGLSAFPLEHDNTIELGSAVYRFQFKD
jgi:predicted component of type VI protein secretion system